LGNQKFCQAKAYGNNYDYGLFHTTKLNWKPDQPEICCFFSTNFNKRFSDSLYNKTEEMKKNLEIVKENDHRPISLKP